MDRSRVNPASAVSSQIRASNAEVDVEGLNPWCELYDMREIQKRKKEKRLLLLFGHRSAPSRIVKCLWEVFVCGVVLVACVCVSVPGVLFSVGVCVCVTC